MTDLLTIAHLASALLVLLVAGLMAAGFVRLAWRSRGLVGHMATGILAVHGAIFLRTLYRDILPLVLGEGSAAYGRLAFLSVTLTLNLLLILAGWHGLRALYLAIPPEDRGRYTLLTAALYPPLRRR